ncbi:MAG: hypothetical protein P8175_03100 [Deltaproteobacteria bacterium]|jgi:hypothetical protein
MTPFQEPHNLPAVLFPNPCLPEPSLKKILSFFGPLRIFQPWYMDREVGSFEKDSSSLVQVLRPPVDLKPAESFWRILADFKSWMDANPDKGYTAFLSAGGMDQGAEDSTWVIRKALREEESRNGQDKMLPVLKWHLVLHLAQEIEDDRQEAERLLGALREKDSPLKGIVEEEDLHTLFYDLPAFGKEPLMEENQRVQVYDAWFSLFGGLLRDHDRLITTDEQAMAHASAIWEEHVVGDEEWAEMSVEFRVPDLSHLSLEGLLSTKARAFAAPVLGEVREAIMAVWEDPKGRMKMLRKRAGEIEKAFPEGLGDGTLSITLSYLKPGTRMPRNSKDLWQKFSGKTLILVSKEKAS